MKDEYKNITITLAGRPYPLKIKDNDEDSIKKIVKGLNEQINNFQLSYNSKDKQDCLSMVLLTVSVELHKLKQQASLKEAEDKLDDLENYMDTLLK